MASERDVARTAATALATVIADEGKPPHSKDPASDPACMIHSSGDGTAPGHDVEDASASPDGKPEAEVTGESPTNPAEEAEPANPGGGKEKGGDPAKGLSSVTSLYCQINGSSHAALVNFGYITCTLCSADLRQPSNLKPQPAKLNINKSKNGVVGDVSYSVEYRDNANNVIGQEPWEGPFDLSTARKGVSQGNASVFKLVTILGTSITTDRHWLAWERNQTMPEGILNNPDIAVTVQTTRLTIHSTPLIQLLRRFVHYYPSVSFNSGVLELVEPFALIAHYYKELEAHRAAHDSKSIADGQVSDGNEGDEHTSGVRHLGTLLDYFQKSMLQHIHDEEARHAQNTCTFRMLWLLYKPGNTVYLESSGRLSAFVVQSVETDPAIVTTVAPNLPKPYVVSVWSLAYDGRYVGRAGRTVTLAPFEGERKIASLRLIPCEFIDKEDGGETRRGLEENGRRWYGLLPGGEVYYSGPLLVSPQKKKSPYLMRTGEEEDSEGAETDHTYLESLHGRVYVDLASFYSYHPEKAPGRNNIQDFGEKQERQERPGRSGSHAPANCQCEECHGRRPHPPPGFPWTHYDILDPVVEKDLSVSGARDGPLHRYLLCDRLLHGFDLKSRTWVQLDVAHCGPPPMNVKAIDHLVMPHERKDMIKALVQKFTNAEDSKGLQRSWAADFIENKGEGQIFLLHGSPGVGKTYTAECIAEYTGRPLLSLTCGDIGTNQVTMEKGLSKWFQLAEKWGAVMLIDEADVYLERRMSADLKRNSLVSVFLRCIEYYRGILFLTTNRVGHFDDAFMSRIHVVIRYDNLSEESRKQIWTQFFDKLENDREDFKITQRAKDYVREDGEISKLEWNGREIRNAFQTAVALAEFRFRQNQDSSKQKQPTLDQKDFERVCNMMKQFKDYMTNVHGLDEEDRAFNTKSRAGRYS